MVWGKAGSTTLTATGNNVTVSSLPNSTFGMVMGSLNSGGTSIRLNEDSSTNKYAVRRDPNGTGDSTNINLTNGYITDSRNNPHFNVTYFCNISGEEKLWINENVGQYNSGAGNAPIREEGVGKYVGTAVTTAFTYFNWAGSTYASGDIASVLGSDLTPSEGKPTNVQAGSRWEETDTRKMYHYGGDNGAITKDAQAIIQNGSTGAQVTSGTFSSFTVGNNTNRALIVASGAYNYHPDIVGITFNGSESFTKIQNYTDGNYKVELWILYNPTVATANVVIDWGSGAGQLGAIVYSFYNVKQSSATGTPVTKTGSSSTTPFIPITPTTAGSMIIDSWYSGSDAAVPNNDETDGMNIICGGVDRSMASQYDLSPTIGSVNNMSRTAGGSSYVQIAVEIKKSIDEWKEEGT